MTAFTGPGPAQPTGGAGRDAALLQHGQLALLVTLILLTVGAWSLTIIQARSMAGMGAVVVPASDGVPMSGMGDMAATDDTAPMPGTNGTGMAGMADTAWSLSGLAAFVGAWAVMMAAMMLPAVAPMLLLYRTIAARTRTEAGAFGATWMLVAGYLLVWTAVGLGVYALMRLGGELAGHLAMAERERWAALALGAALILAGLYQFTPLKHACLRQCQSPFGFVMGHWRDGPAGAFRMGVLHGAYCLGCCWALFAVLVVAGVMSLAWMLLLTLVIFAEKVLPQGDRIAVAVGIAFIVLGTLIASGAAPMPWLA